MTGTTKTDIFVYTHWKGMPVPKWMGTLAVHQGKGRKSFCFEYHSEYLKSKERFLLDQAIGWYSGSQFLTGTENFGIFLDSIPDTWGRTLMKRSAAQKAKEEKRSATNLYDIDFILGVCDEIRMGALRFKLDQNGPFLWPPALH